MTFGRTYLQCAVVALVILPGAVGLGGLVFAPLALIVVSAIVFLRPEWLLYNVSLLLVAASATWLAAKLVHRYGLTMCSRATRETRAP
jgi:hypothetical protein